VVYSPGIEGWVVAADSKQKNKIKNQKIKKSKSRRSATSAWMVAADKQ
jgi:hypothetical protein